jgi:two-component system, LuxR family, response regulator FixJ
MARLATLRWAARRFRRPAAACRSRKVAMTARAIVYVIDDDPDLSGSLRSLLESAGLAVVTFQTGREFLTKYDHDTTPGCVLLDVRMPDMGGLQLQREFATRKITLPIIFTTAFANVPMAVRAMRRGAFDFLEKPLDADILLERIHEAIEVDRQRREKRNQEDAIAGRLANLSAREREVMGFVVLGKANKEIAYELGLSQKTVEVHRARLMRKLQVDSLAALVRLATSN